MDEARCATTTPSPPTRSCPAGPPASDQRRIALTRSGLQTARVGSSARGSTASAPPSPPRTTGWWTASTCRKANGWRPGNITRVVNLNALRIEANVLEHDLPLIKEGGNALITSAAAPDEQVTGRISAVLPVIDSTTRSGRAYVRLAGGGKLRPGMYADVRLEASRLTNRRLVPARAVIERDGRPLVFVVKDGRAQWVYILPGRTNGIETEVLAA